MDSSVIKAYLWRMNQGLEKGSIRGYKRLEKGKIVTKGSKYSLLF